MTAYLVEIRKRKAASICLERGLILSSWIKTPVSWVVDFGYPCSVDRAVGIPEAYIAGHLQMLAEGWFTLQCRTIVWVTGST